MKICYFGIYNPNYSRNDILLSGLNQIGVEVIQCNADWRDLKDILSCGKIFALCVTNMIVFMRLIHHP